jgi:hypothetical protein
MSYERRRLRVTVRGFGRIRFGRSSAGGTPDTGANVRSVALAMAMAAILLAVFNSDEMRAFARDLPINSFTDVLVEGADKWHALMLELGPARLRPIVREAFSTIRSATW